MPLFNIFIRSLRATGSQCKCVVITVDFQPNQFHKDFARHYDVEFVPSSTVRTQHHLYHRFSEWDLYMQKHGHEYDFVINCDYDVFFQIEPFQFFFSKEINPISHQYLHVFGENPIRTIGECPFHKTWYQECASLNGPVLLGEHASRPRICAGFTIGTTRSHQLYLKRMTLELKRSTCNDQGIHNMLIWSNSFQDFNVYVWDYWDGPVKHTDVGFLRDQYGTIMNEQGLPYCVIHQFKFDRNSAFLNELVQFYALHGAPYRFVLEDTRFPVCTHPSCNGKRVHRDALIMIAENMTKGFWGEIPRIHSSENITAQLPSPPLSVASGYRTVATFLPRA